MSEDTSPKSSLTKCIIFFLFLYPLAQILIFYFRFYQMDLNTILDSLLYFAPLGAITGAIYFLFTKSTTSTLSVKIIFAIGVFFSLILAIFAGLIFAPIFAVPLIGSIPTIIAGLIIKSMKHT